MTYGIPSAKYPDGTQDQGLRVEVVLWLIGQVVEYSDNQIEAKAFGKRTRPVQLSSFLGLRALGISRTSK